MKVIFLDIDGVLNWIGCPDIIQDVYFVNDEKIFLLKEIIDRTGAKVVLSSTWRFGWFDRDNGINTEKSYRFEKLEEKLADNGIEFLSKTPVIKHASRGKVIQKWLENWNGEKIENFVILDDGCSAEPYADRLILTSTYKGLQSEDVEKAVSLLNK